MVAVHSKVFNVVVLERIEVSDAIMHKGYHADINQT